jgi:hypothetical protein
MGRGKESGKTPTAAVSDQHRPFGFGRIQDCTQVIRPHVEVRHPEDSVGETRAAFVKQDDPREGRKPLEESCTPRSLELDLEIPSHAQRVHEIDWPIATHLVGDVHAIDRSRVAHLGLLHVGSNPSPRTRRMQTRSITTAFAAIDPRRSFRNIGPRRGLSVLGVRSVVLAWPASSISLSAAFTLGRSNGRSPIPSPRTSQRALASRSCARAKSLSCTSICCGPPGMPSMLPAA